MNSEDFEKETVIAEVQHEDSDHNHEECCEHEHHHSVGCGCSHEHHHHDDGEDCDCGHEHHHHHHHEHGEDCDCEDCVAGVSIVHHEEALAGSFSVETQLGKEELDAIIRESMLKLAEIIEASENGVIGHIKAAISSEDCSAMYSLTYDVVSRVGEFDALDRVETVSYAAIVYGLTADVLRAHLIGVKERL